MKKGITPESFKKRQAVLSQKDVDWTKKDHQNYYGYKNHVLIDSKHKLIRDFEVTPANIHDSQAAPKLFLTALPGYPGYGDSAYISNENKAAMALNEIEDQVNEKGVKNKPLTEQQKLDNRKKLKI